MTLIEVLIVAAAVAAALVLGWYLGGRVAAQLKGECETLRARCGDAEKAHAAAEERGRQAELLRMTLTEVTRERDQAIQDLRELQADARNFENRMQELVAAKEALSAQFSEIGSKLLNDVQRQFLERADQRFTQASEKNEAQLKALLQPVETTLKQYDEKLATIEKDRVGSYGELREAVRLLHAGHSQVRDETRNLVNALRSSPKARGNWGERSLKNVLEQAGLSQHIDFQTEVSVNTGDGRLRPDVIVNLPGGRKLIVDAKCSLNAFLDAADQVDDVLRADHMKRHLSSIRRHVEQLGSKAYWEQFGGSADYVIMYIPGEHFLAAALEQALKDDPPQDLWTWAFERHVLLATPTNLVAIARTVASVWRQEKLAEQAAEIAKLGKELHNRIATMGEHVRKLGQNLERANGAYNSFVGSLEGQVMSQAKRFEALEVAGGAREIEPLPMVESSPRPLTKLIADLPAAAE
jgi:DNA recombination protein RmuC